MTPHDRMEAAYAADPIIGRKRLMRQCGVSSGAAQRFLEKKRGKTSKPAEAPTTQQPNKYAFLDGLSDHELNHIRQSVVSTPAKYEAAPVSWGGSSFKFAAISDTHIGHNQSHRAWWDRATDLINRSKCDFVVHSGDITEGMSGRPGHVYELAQLGTGAQVAEAVARLKRIECPIKAITGNHDLWAYKTTGADPGAMIAASLPNFEYLGMNEADIEVQGVKIRLFHPGDGAAYALSYSGQKIVESFTGGEKPHILLIGHHHKSVAFMTRNVYVQECATLCGQTEWMRGKKLAAHVGFWINEVWPLPDGGIERITQEWVPFFK